MNVRKARTRRNEQRRMRKNRVLRVLIATGGLTVVVLMCVLLYTLTTGSGITSEAQRTPQVTGAPKLQVNQDKIEMGDVTLGKTVQAEFELTNTGDRTLQFTSRPYIEVLEGC